MDLDRPDPVLSIEPRRRRLVRRRTVAAGAAITLAAGALVAIAVTRARDDGPSPLEGIAVDWRTEPDDATLAGRAPDPGKRHAEQFYFVLPDRFGNGDKRNDRGGLTGDRLSTGLDVTDKGFYHGGDIRGVLDRLDYIQGLGTTAIWLAPIFKNRPVQGEGASASAGYHGYWITDFTQVDPHFGTQAELERLVSEAHRRGIKIYLDIITNHTADVIKYRQGGTAYRNKADHPYQDASGRPFEDRNYADGTRTFPLVNTGSFPYTPVFDTPADARVKVPAWLNDPTMYHNRGDSTFSGENSEYGDFFGLDDLWTERPEVVAGMSKIYGDWILKAGVDGFRIDTAKHVNMAFWPQWTKNINGYASAGGKSDFFMFGEVFSADPEFASTYVRQGQLPATLDFSFQDAAVAYVANGGPATRLADLYGTDDLYTTGHSTANELPTFLGNHDMGRVGMFITNGPSASPAEDLRRAVLAEQLMFLTRGQPVVYSGDEQGFVGEGGDKDARQDMFASQVADYLDDPLIGTSNTHAVDNYNRQHPIYRAIADLAALRKAHPALRTGLQVTRYAAETAGVFAFSRIEPTNPVEYLVAVNNSISAQSVSVPTYSAGAAFTPIYPAAGAPVTTDGDRKLNLTVPPLSAVVLRAGAPVGAGAAPTVTISSPAAGAGVTKRAVVIADVQTTGPATVTFAVKIGDAGWKLLGTADHAPYRVYHDLTGLPANTHLKYKAVVRDSAGRLASAKSPAFVATAPVTAPRDHLVVHYLRGGGAYDPWGLYAWGDIDPSSATPWPAGQPFAGEDAYGRFAWLKLRPGATNVGFLVVDANGTKDVPADRFADPTKNGEIWLKAGDPKVYTSKAQALGQVTVHYGRPDGEYAGWGLHLWGDGLAPGARTDWADPRMPDGIDAYGAYWNVPVGDVTKAVNIIVHKGDAKDPGPDQSVLPAEHGDVWIRSGENAVHPTLAAAEHTAVLHYRRPDGIYTGWGLHVWTGAAAPTDWSTPLLLARIDSYGAVLRVPLSDGATSLSYIVHKGDEKDLPSDQSLDFAANGQEVWLLAGQQRYLLPIPAGAVPDTNLSKVSAQWLNRGTVAWKAGPPDDRSYALLTSAEGNLAISDGAVTGTYTTLRLIANRNGLTEAERQAFPHLWQYPTFSVDRRDLGKVPDALRGQVIAVERNHEGKVLAATSVQLPGVLDDVYRKATEVALGPTFADGRPTLALWAPTARDVKLELFDSPAAEASLVDMKRDDATGVWKVTGQAGWKGRYYRFRVTVWQPAAGRIVTASVTDPYSVSLAADSTHSQIVDLRDAALAPPGWTALRKPTAVPPSKIQIQELSVRDFSIADASIPADKRGTFLAFAAPDGAGMSHLASAARAGLTHVHLMPLFDFSSAPERRANQSTPDCDLPSLPPDSAQQQACIAAFAATDGYNWGYDPWHYTVPEGSYATTPDGAVRITELRQAVAGLNEAGLRVVLDVVYNHTSAAGTELHSVLDQIVPGYYQRLLDDGTLATSTCCANTAPEHAMMGKLVVDSIVTWARQYKVDGFRFDLMGHHPKANMLAVRAALDQLTVAKDGVDGRSIYVYGEGWDFGEIAGNARFTQATQANMAGTGIGTFNDRLRDAVRGGGPFDANPRLQGFATGLYTDPNGDPVNGTAAQQRASLLHQQDLIKVGLAGNLAGYRFVDSSGTTVVGSQVTYNDNQPGGYAANPADAITYVDAHDNEILYDALAFKLPTGTPDVDRARMQVLALSTTILGQGVGFAAGGSHLLRSKSLDKNSYDSGDWFNAIRWDCTAGNGFGLGLPPAADNAGRWPYAGPLLADPALIPGCDAVALSSARYRELLTIKNSSPLFSLGSAAAVQQQLSFPLSGTPGELPGVITMRLSDGKRSIVVIFNATPDAQTQRLSGYAGTNVSLHPVLRSSVDPVLAGATADRTTGTFTVPGRTVAIFVQG